MSPISRSPLPGLALGGGGARGFAHIGVLKILEADDIKPQLLSGTSMGAVIAAMYTAGLTAKEIEEEALRMGSISNIGNMVNLLDSDLAKLSNVVSNIAVQKYLSEL